IHNMVCPDRIQIVARKGEFYLLDTTAGDHIRHTVFALPTNMGKGVTLMLTAHGNLLIGPTAVDIDDKDGTDTTRAGLDYVAARCAITIKDVPLRDTITQFAGLRAHRPEHEFLIEESGSVPGFFDVAGIESPGFTCAPAIGVYVAEMVSESRGLAMKPEGTWKPGRKPTVDLTKLTPDEWALLCDEDPAYGNIVCRCRTVSEAQIVDAIHRDPGAHSVDGVKRRTCAGMGRCQGGFCSPKVMDILAREIDSLELEDVTKRGPGSELITGHVKDERGGDAR
ncbi:MAG: FAD-dependent oxidoreductase, partial [Atopobiaceae bacterium]|nr:FAD-dependent oxidoreductase [Atopobiaceae bacterium]